MKWCYEKGKSYRSNKKMTWYILKFNEAMPYHSPQETERIDIKERYYFYKGGPY